MTDEAHPSQQITIWLSQWRAGDARASERLFAAVYPGLQRIAAGFLRNERVGHTLDSGALVNEFYLRTVGSYPLQFKDRAHFFAIAAQTMRRILIDHARARIAEKRGGVQQRLSLSMVDGWNPIAHYEDLLTLDQALRKLERADPRAAKVVEMRFFGGLLEEEAAGELGVSVITVKRDWRVAKAWLIAQLQSRSVAPTEGNDSL